MQEKYTSDYLLDKKVKIFQPVDGYRASSDAVLLAAFVENLPEGAKVLDVGSGTGAVALCLAARFQKQNISIDGAELQPQLAELANYSAKQNGFDFVRFHNFDIYEKPHFLLPCSYDVVVTNPPYSDHDMPSPNKSKALAHNHNNSNLSRWLKFCLKMTKPFGKIYVVNRCEALPEICSSLANYVGNITILPIYSKKGQEAKRILVMLQKDSKAPSRILPPFVMHDENGAYTEAAEEILRKGFCFVD